MMEMKWQLKGAAEADWGKKRLGQAGEICSYRRKSKYRHFRGELKKWDLWCILGTGRELSSRNGMD